MLYMYMLRNVLNILTKGQKLGAGATQCVIDTATTELTHFFTSGTFLKIYIYNIPKFIQINWHISERIHM